MVSPPEQLSKQTEESATPLSIEHGTSTDFDGSAKARELRMWIRALGSFLVLRNHPLLDANSPELMAHDWAHELRIIHATLLHCARLAFQLVQSEESDQTIFDEPGTNSSLEGFSSATFADEAEAEPADDSPHAMAVAFGDASEACRTLLSGGTVGLHAWMNLANGLAKVIDRYGRAKIFSRMAAQRSNSIIPAPLLAITQKSSRPPALSADMRLLFFAIFELLEDLSYVENLLRRDQSLKQTLPIFTLVHEDGRALANLIKHRMLRIEGLERHISETLDSINYAIMMELRKVFAYELVGLSSLRQAPAIYIKVENSHGLLRDSFRQSAIGLAQLFDPSLEGQHLFNAFQTKLEQSLRLRRDLWHLLERVRQAEKEPSAEAIQALLDDLASFYEVSLRYLMFKDWESCEHFLEEIGAARGGAELVPILHRFAAYLEALSNQVNMRAVLIGHPFNPEVESTQTSS